MTIGHRLIGFTNLQLCESVLCNMYENQIIPVQQLSKWKPMAKFAFASVKDHLTTLHMIKQDNMSNSWRPEAHFSDIQVFSKITVDWLTKIHFGSTDLLFLQTLTYKSPRDLSCCTCSAGRGGGVQSEPDISPSTSSTTYSWKTFTINSSKRYK